MDKQTAEILCNLTSDFYRREAASFSQTRNHPWPGWRRCLEAMEGLEELKALEGPGEKPLRVLDVACGNLRFERFLLQEFSEAKWDFCAVDNCDDLALRAIGDLSEGAIDGMAAAGDTMSPTAIAAANETGSMLAAAGPSVRYVHADVMGELLAGSPLACTSAEASEKPFDIAVAFGFMHHIPGHEKRCSFLRALLERVCSGGHVAVSFWRFMAEEKLASKAVETTERALRVIAAGLVDVAADEPAVATSGSAAAASIQLEENDYLLGWRDSQEVFRYCHHFSESEISALANAVADVATVAARFHADGRTGDLNTYLVLRRN